MSGRDARRVARSFTPKDLVQLPRLSAREALVLVAQLDTALAVVRAGSKPKGLPAALVRSMGRLKDAAAPLAALLSPHTESDTSAKRAADRVLDAAWSALHSWLLGWCLLPETVHPQHAQACALRDLVFADRLGFTQLRYRLQWQESEARLAAIDAHGHAAVIKKLGGAVFLDHLRAAHRTYGEALHITRPLPTLADSDIKTGLLATLDAIRDYATRVAALADPDEPGSEALAEALLRPVTRWESHAGEGKRSEVEPDAAPAVPAQPEENPE
jgi:hypothetical protein